MAGSYGGIVAIRTRGCFYGIEVAIHLPASHSAFAFRIYDPSHKVDIRHNLKAKYKSDPHLARFFNLDYFDAYLGFDSPVAAEDPRAEAGIFKYGDRPEWTYFLNTVNPPPKPDPAPPAKPSVPGAQAHLPRLLDEFRQDMAQIVKTSRVLATPLQQGVTWTEQNIGQPPAPLIVKLIFDPGDPTKVSFFVNGKTLFTRPLRFPIDSSTYAKGGLRMKACVGMDNGLGTIGFDKLSIDHIKVFEDKKCENGISLAEVGFDPVLTPDRDGVKLRPEGKAGTTIQANHNGGRSEQQVLAELKKLGVTL